jgi:hypothetical protein
VISLGLGVLRLGTDLAISASFEEDGGIFVNWAGHVSCALAFRHFFERADDILYSDTIYISTQVLLMNHCQAPTYRYGNMNLVSVSTTV